MRWIHSSTRPGQLHHHIRGGFAAHAADDGLELEIPAGRSRRCAGAPEFNDSSWQAVDLPHDWSIYGPFDQNAVVGGGGGYLPVGVGWYRKTFSVPDAYKDKKVAIEFDGVYENSEVWINGHSLGKRPFGYISFVYDLSPYLNFGKDNVLAVRADNSVQPNSRWYSGSGIDRHTWLLVTDGLHIPQWGTYVTTPNVSADSADIKLAVRVTNDRAETTDFEMNCSLIDQQGAPVATTSTGGHIDGSVGRDMQIAMTLAKPHLWSIDDPYLYTVRCEISENGKTVDQYDTPIGIRSIAFDVDKGFLLNGQHVKLNGVCVHQDAGCVGSAVPEGVWERRLKLLKEMGCNAIRTSHNPPTPELLDLCDKMGMCVMDESFDEWQAGKVRQGYHLFFDKWWQQDVTDFVHRDRNHPSIVLWSCGNEIPDQTSVNGVEIVKGLVDLFHKEDPTRLVTAACDKAFAEPKSAPPEFLGALDVVGYNYADRWRERAQSYYSEDRQAYPKRLFVGTESISMGGVRGDYSYLFPSTTPPPQPVTTPTTGPGGRRGFGGGGFGRATASGRVDVEQLWKFVRTYDYVAGDFMWTGIDYIGEARWPGKGASSGMLDTCGFPKDGYYFYQSQWTTKPVLHAFPHWNWKGKEGQIIPITCFTNCDSVELFLNGKSFGQKGYEFPREGMEERYGNSPARSRAVRTTSDLHLSWDVPYEPGTVKLVGTINGQTAATEEIVTTGDAAAIELTSDMTALTADGRDVAHFTVRIVDDKGNTVPTAGNDVTFDLQGRAKSSAWTTATPPTTRASR